MRASAEEWHPWVKQMESTHLACIKLGGGFPDTGAALPSQGEGGGRSARRGRSRSPQGRRRSRSPRGRSRSPPIQDRTNQGRGRGGKRGRGSGRRRGGGRGSLPALNPYQAPQAPMEPRRRRRAHSAEGKRRQRARTPPDQYRDHSLPQVRRRGVDGAAEALAMHGPERPDPGNSSHTVGMFSAA